MSYFELEEQILLEALMNKVFLRAALAILMWNIVF